MGLEVRREELDAGPSHVQDAAHRCAPRAMTAAGPAHAGLGARDRGQPHDRVALRAAGALRDVAGLADHRRVGRGRHEPGRAAAADAGASSRIRLVGRGGQPRGRAGRAPRGAGRAAGPERRRAGGLPATEAEEARLVQRVETVRRVADQLREEYQRARIAEAVEAGQVEIVDVAPLPAEPVGSRRGLKLALGLMLGLMLGSGAPSCGRT
jgi:hypothetical protein